MALGSHVAVIAVRNAAASTGVGTTAVWLSEGVALDNCSAGGHCLDAYGRRICVAHVSTHRHSPSTTGQGRLIVYQHVGLHGITFDSGIV